MKQLWFVLLLSLAGNLVSAQEATSLWNGSWVLRLGAAELDIGLNESRVTGQLNAGFAKQFGKRWLIGAESVGHLWGNSGPTSSGWGWSTDPWWMGVSTRLYLAKFHAERRGIFPFVELSAGGMLWSGYISSNPNGNRPPPFPRAWQWGLSPRAGLIWRMTPEFSTEVMGMYLPYAEREANQIAYLLPHDLSLSVNFSYYFHFRKK